jgi:hypothetical protein
LLLGVIIQGGIFYFYGDDKYAEERYKKAIEKLRDPLGSLELQYACICGTLCISES